MSDAEMPLLSEKLTLGEQLALGSLSAHPGYIVLEKMIRAAVDEANTKVVMVSPDNPNYNRVLAAVQQEARATNTFARRVLRSINSHGKQAAFKSKTEEAMTLEKMKSILAEVE